MAARAPRRRPQPPPARWSAFRGTVSKNVSRIYGGGVVPQLQMRCKTPDLDDDDPMASAKRFMYTAAADKPNKMPSRPSSRIEHWKSKMQRKRRPSSMEWDTISSTPSSSSKGSSIQPIPGSNFTVEKAMQPPMFARSEASKLLQLVDHETKGNPKFKKPAVPDKLPAYKLTKRIRGTWAYIPPDTRQEAVESWFVKHVKKPPPTVEKVHVAFGRISYPSGLRHSSVQPQPVVDIPRMTYGAR